MGGHTVKCPSCGITRRYSKDLIIQRGGLLNASWQVFCKNCGEKISWSLSE